MTVSLNLNKAVTMNAIKKTAGTAWYGDVFSIIPFDAVLDKRLKPRHLKVLLILAKHADKFTGIAYPSLDRIAEMCGFYSKDLPDRALVSRLISNASGKGTGPGLVQLGYVQKLGWIANRTSQSYRVQRARVATGDLNQPTDRKISDEEFQEKQDTKKAEQRAKDDADAEAYFAEENVADEEIENSAKPTPKKPAIVVSSNEEYTRDEVRQAYHDGDWGYIPRAVIESFGFSYSFAE